MKQVFCDGKGELLLKDVPTPICAPGQLLVCTASSIISAGTEATALAGGGSLLKQALRRPDLVRRALDMAARKGVKTAVGLVRAAAESWYPLGYSAAGTVIEVGEGVAGFSVGDRVACAGAGYANHSEFISVPRNLVVALPDTIRFHEGCFATVGAIALQGVRRVDPTIGETVVVIGVGLIGLLTAQILCANGCRVICVDLAAARLKLAASLGIEHTLRAGAGDVVQSVLALTGGDGADGVIVTAATKSSEPLNQAASICRESGRVVIVGAVGMDLDREQYYRNEIDLRISRSYGPGRYDPEYEQKGMVYPLGYVRWTETRNLTAFLELVAAGKVAVKVLISAEYDIQQAKQAYAKATAGAEETVAVLFRYARNGMSDGPERVWWQPQQLPPKGGRVGMALVGAGRFVRAVHIPNLKSLASNVTVRAVVSGSGGSARQAAEKLGAPVVATDLSAVLQSEDVEAVLIATRHNLHAEQCIAAARAGKHVFVEKPLALTGDECREIMVEVEKAGVLCAVGFNRRFSPLSLALRETLDRTGGPKQIICRVNAGPLPKTHWLLDPDVGGGRLLGEACHFFDLMAWVANSKPVSVIGQAIGHSADDVSVVVKFADGCVGTLIYTGLGNPAFPKERLEVLAGGGVAVLDDFRSLMLYGLHGKSRKLRVQDKGHRALLEHFVNSVRGQDTLTITAEDGLLATSCAIAALESVAQGKVVAIRC